MIVFVDTSAFYAVLDRDDEHYKTAFRIWKSLLEEDATLVTSNYVLVETCALLQHRLGIEAVRTFQQQIVPLLSIEWIGAALHSAAIAALLTANRKKVSLVDCASFGVMREAGIAREFAFDRHFVEQGFECQI